MGDIKASPRNRFLGLLADGLQGASDFASKPFGYDNPPVQAALGLLGIPALTNTVNELSYGGALGTGKGMTWKPKADTVDALMVAAPLGATAGKAAIDGGVALAKKAAPAIERAVPRIMERGGLPAQLLGDMSQGTISPATVWHGSPHKFDKFDASKIGTGEGAQAYGHGLYLAESPDVAKQYSKLGEIASINGMPIAGPKKAVNPDSAKSLGVQPTTLDWLGNNGWNVKQAMDAAGAEAQAASTIGDKAFYHQITGDLKRLMKSDVDVGAGQVYKVDLPDDAIAKMLDWDKPLSQQHPDVQKALEPLGYKYDPQAATAHDDALLGALFGDSTAAVPKIPQNPMGADIARGKGIFDQPQDKVIAEKLRQAGIPGIRYLDGGSRGTGAGTSNFVVFPGNEGLLTILERNGQKISDAPGLLNPAGY